jgi:hypothetical protein
MKHTIFAGNRKRLRVPAYVNVVLRNWHWWESGKQRDHFVYWSREERDRMDLKLDVLYRINVYPKGDTHADINQ